MSLSYSNMIVVCSGSYLNMTADQHLADGSVFNYAHGIDSCRIGDTCPIYPVASIEVCFDISTDDDKLEEYDL